MPFARHVSRTGAARAGATVSVLSLFLLVIAGACGRGEPARGGMGGEHPGMGAMGQPGPQTAPGAVGAAPSGAVDVALAGRGEQLFQTKGCVGCHTVGGGRHTAPDLQGVTQRRSYDWIVAMVVNPDSMLKNDAAARQLLREYMTPMMNMGITMDEARALYEYLRQQSQ